MEIPRSSSDIAFALPCPACNGNGGHGNRSDTSNPFNACTSCKGTGWNLKRAPQLTPTERQKILCKLAI
jgi:DnaJ-class molecular chaperone